MAASTHRKALSGFPWQPGAHPFSGCDLPASPEVTSSGAERSLQCSQAGAEATEEEGQEGNGGARGTKGLWPGLPHGAVASAPQGQRAEFYFQLPVGAGDGLLAFHTLAVGSLILGYVWLFWTHTKASLSLFATAPTTAEPIAAGHMLATPRRPGHVRPGSKAEPPEPQSIGHEPSQHPPSGAPFPADASRREITSSDDSNKQTNMLLITELPLFAPAASSGSGNNSASADLGPRALASTRRRRCLPGNRVDGMLPFERSSCRVPSCLSATFLVLVRAGPESHGHRERWFLPVPVEPWPRSGC